MIKYVYIEDLIMPRLKVGVTMYSYILCCDANESSYVNFIDKRYICVSCVKYRSRVTTAITSFYTYIDTSCWTRMHICQQCAYSIARN